MKKVILLGCALCFVPGLLAYTSDDVILANTLADAGIIVSHRNNPDAYRLDSAVARQEVIGMTLKLRGVGLPMNYDCQGHFSDATFPKDHTDAWVCRAVELAADRGLITRENSTTRPRDNITKAEALAMIWKGAGMDITDYTGNEAVGSFVDYRTNPAVTANQWQENLLQTARKMGIITPKSVGPTWDWRHNAPATRKEVFAIIATFQTLKDAGKQLPYLTFSGEVGYTPGKTKLISTDPALVQKMKDKDFSAIIDLLKPIPLQTRVEGSVFYTLEKVPERWGFVQFSSVAVLGDKIIQQYSAYNPYGEAIKAMLKRFNLSSEAEFYALPYGLLWEQTRDFVETYFIDLLSRAKIIYPEGSPIIP